MSTACSEKPNSIPQIHLSCSRVTARTLIPIVEWVQKNFVNPSRFFSQTGLSQEFFQSENSHVSYQQWLNVLETAIQLSKDPMVAIHAVDSAPLHWSDPLLYIFITSENLELGFKKVFEYRKLIHTSVEAGVVERGSEILLYHKNLAVSKESFFVNDFILMTFLKAARTGQNDFSLKPTRVHVVYEKPIYWKSLEECFGAPIQFSSDRCEIYFSTEVMRKALPERDKFLASLLDQHVKSLLNTVPAGSGFAHHIQHLIAESVDDPKLSVASIARKFPMSERSFYRKLKAENINFQELYDSVRFSSAQAYLKDSKRSVAEVAFLLGFSEVSSFSRAFKRWSGFTPARFRKQNP